MNASNKLEKIFKNIQNEISLESFFINENAVKYFWHRFKFFIVGSIIFYVSYLLKLYYIGENYSSFYINKIIVLEQFAFWSAQLLWLIIISKQKPLNQVQHKYKILPKNWIFIYFILVIIPTLVYLKTHSLFVLTHFNVYTCVSFIFIIQILFTVYLKFIHAHVYAKKRVYINMPIVIFSHAILVILQVFFWNKYLYWSVPIILGLQLAVYSALKLYYYTTEFNELKIEQSTTKNKPRFFTFILSQDTVSAVLVLIPEILFFFLIKTFFLSESSYQNIIFLMSALINSRLTSLLLQDFLKYNTDNYNSYFFKYIKKSILPLLMTTFLMFILASMFNYILFHSINIKIVALSFLLSCLLGLSNLVMQFLFSRKVFKLILILSFLTSIVLIIILSSYQYYDYLISFTATSIYILCLVLISWHLKLFSKYFLSSVCYTRYNFKYLTQVNRFKFTYLINLSKYNYYHAAISEILNEKIKCKSVVWIINSKKVVISSYEKNIDVRLLFYCSNIERVTDFDSHNFNDESAVKIKLDDIAKTNYNLKLYFNSITKKHKGGLKKINS